MGGKGSGRERKWEEGERWEEWNGKTKDDRIWEVGNENEVVEGESTKSCKAEEQLKNVKGTLGDIGEGGVKRHCTFNNNKPVLKILGCCKLTKQQRGYFKDRISYE